MSAKFIKFKQDQEYKNEASIKRSNRRACQWARIGLALSTVVASSCLSNGNLGETSTKILRRWSQVAPPPPPQSTISPAAAARRSFKVHTFSLQKPSYPTIIQRPECTTPITLKSVWYKGKTKSRRKRFSFLKQVNRIQWSEIKVSYLLRLVYSCHIIRPL